MEESIQSILRWYSAESVVTDVAQLCSSRDIFQARLDSCYRKLCAKLESQSAQLLTALIGEIGNNSFDHNLGKWRDVPGCWFEFDSDESSVWIVIADRGQGIKNSLQPVDPALTTDQLAIEAAFEKRISGRSPEKRGNGLKFVRSIINSNQNRGLLSLSGTGRLTFGGSTEQIERLLSKNDNTEGNGTFLLLYWKG